jgi:hypothetical protein
LTTEKTLIHTSKKYSLVENGEEKTDNTNFVIFNTKKLETINVKNENSITRETIKKYNTLYKVTVGEDTPPVIVYSYKDAANNIKSYDKSNSTLAVQLNNADTKKLAPRTYYYQIDYKVEAVINGELLTYKETLLEPSEFVVKGALN